MIAQMIVNVRDQDVEHHAAKKLRCVIACLGAELGERIDQFGITAMLPVGAVETDGDSGLAQSTLPNPGQIGAPMPGAIASVAVTPGQAVKAGDVLLTIEAMKMETGIHADKDGTVKAIHVSQGTQIDAKDLIIEIG